jgi:hypothetical protein
MLGRSFRWLRIGTVAWLCLTSASASRPLAVEASPVFAYLTDSQLVVMRGTEPIAHAAIPNKTKTVNATWTLDGRYVAAIKADPGAPDDASAGLLLVVDAATGSVRQMPCPSCQSAAPAGRSLLLVSQSVPQVGDPFRSMLRFDLSTTRPPVQVPSRLTSLDEAAFLAGSSEVALLLGVRNNDDDFFLVRPDGTASQVGTKYFNVMIDTAGTYYGRGIRAAASLQTAETTLFAIASTYTRQDGQCGGIGDVYIAKAGQQLFDINVSQFVPPVNSQGSDRLFVPRDLWWDNAGELHAVMAAGVCGHGGGFTTPPTEWRLVQGHWNQISPEPVLSVRQLTEDTRVVIGFDRRNHSDPLYLYAKGKRTKLAERVRAILAPPLPTRPSPAADLCPLAAGRCAGEHSGDIDGDSRADRIGLTTVQYGASPIGPTTLTAHVLFGDGRHLDQNIVPSVDPQSTAWLGITDANGDGRGDLFIVTNQGAHGTTVAVFEYRDGRLQPLRGDFNGVLAILKPTGNVGGFACRRTAEGVAQIVNYYVELNLTADSPRYEAFETAYESQNGVMRQRWQRSVTYPAKPRGGSFAPPDAVIARAGAHCPGLDVFPPPPRPP